MREEEGGEDREGGGGKVVKSETARQLEIAQRWGCLDREGLSEILMEKTIRAVFSNQTVELEHVVGVNGAEWEQFSVVELINENITQLLADGADVNFQFQEMYGWTGT